MNIVLKNLFKNVFGKFFRTLLVTFAIFMCCLCAMLSFDLGDSLGRILTDFYGSVSRADFFAFAGGSDLSTLPDGYPESDFMTATVNNEMLYKNIDGEYDFVTTDSLTIFGIDVDEAEDMEFMSKIDINDGEMYISQDFADDYGYQAGDKITVHDRAQEEVELTIAGIYSDSKNPLLAGNSAIINLNTSDILSCGTRRADIVLIDVHDDSRIQEAEDMLKFAYPDITTTDLFLSDANNMMLNEIKMVFYLMFAITFLLVIFVTASICQRIVSERMSYIGTLRSLGMSTGRTAGILLLENVFYALMGSIPAIVLYGLVRDPILTAMFGLDEQIGSLLVIPKLSPVLVIGVVLMAIAIECLIPLKSILKALKTPIRDIIFDNRDTEYRYGKSALVVGLILLALAVVMFFFRGIMLCAILCLIASVISLALLFPRVIKLVTKGIGRFCEKNDMASWSLASVEASTKKSTVSSGVLSATAAAMCIVVYTIASSMNASINELPYDCDVVMQTTKAMKYYSYVDNLDTVTDAVPLYYTAVEIVLNEEDTRSVAYIYGYTEDSFEFYTGFESMEEPEEGKVLVDKKYANRKGLSAGDQIQLTINPDGAFPYVRKYTVQDVIESNESDGGTEAVILNIKEFKTLFLDQPGEILIRCGDPDAVKSKLETYAKGTYQTVDTKQELIEQLADNNSKSKAVITTIIVVALGMTAIGMISNQLIGFEGRKKECAVMLSTAMGKGRLAGILLKEVLITSFTASAVGTLVGTALCFVLREALQNAELITVDVVIDPVKIILFFVLLTVVFTLTVLFPIRNLRKMKISEQIKYE